MAHITGIVYVKVDGELQSSLEGAKLTLGGKERTEVVGHSLYGYTDKYVPAVVTFEIGHVGGDDIIGLQNKVDSTLEFETDTGDTYVIRNAFATKPAELSGGDGKVALEFKGAAAEKL